MTDHRFTIRDDNKESKINSFVITDYETTTNLNIEISKIKSSELFNLLIDTDGTSGNIAYFDRSFDDPKSSLRIELENLDYNFQNLKTLILHPYNKLWFSYIDTKEYPLWLSNPPELPNNYSDSKYIETAANSSGLIYIDMNNSIGSIVGNSTTINYFGGANNKLTDIILIYNEILNRMLERKTKHINIFSNAFDKYPNLKNVYIYGIPNFWNVNNHNNYYLFHENVRLRNALEEKDKINFYFIKPSNITKKEYAEKINTFLHINSNSDNITNGCLLKPDSTIDDYKKENDCINTKIFNYEKDFKYFKNIETFQEYLINKCQISDNSKFIKNHWKDLINIESEDSRIVRFTALKDAYNNPTIDVEVSPSLFGSSDVLFNLLIKPKENSSIPVEIDKTFDDPEGELSKELENYGYNFRRLRTLILYPYKNRFHKTTNVNPLWLSGLLKPVNTPGLIYIDMNNYIGFDNKEYNNSSYFGNDNVKITDIILIYNKNIKDPNHTAYIDIFSNAFDKYPNLKNVYIYGIPNFWNVNNHNNYYLFHETARKNKINFYFIKPSNITKKEYAEKINTFLYDNSNSNNTNGCLLKPDSTVDDYKKENDCINIHYDTAKNFLQIIKDKCQISVGSEFDNCLDALINIEDDDENNNNDLIEETQIIHCSVE